MPEGDGRGRYQHSVDVQTRAAPLMPREPKEKNVTRLKVDLPNGGVRDVLSLMREVRDD